jgi:hypothetical protein
MSEVITMPDRKTAVYVTKALEGFIIDPPDSDYQRGYLEALCVLGEECLSIPADLIFRARNSNPIEAA